MLVYLPPLPVFFDQECTDCEDYTTHRVDMFEYMAKKHAVTCRITCTNCEQRGYFLEIKYPTYFVTFKNEEWSKFVEYIGLITFEN